MPRNGSGTYVLPAGQPVTSLSSISSTDHNTLMNDIANTLTTSIATDGQTPMTANLPMGNNKITGLATGTLTTDAATKGQMDAAISSAASTINAAMVGRNFIVNGAMNVAQIGTSAALTTTDSYFCLDNWAASMAATADGTIAQQAVTGGSRSYVAKIGRTAASTSTGAIRLSQALETVNSLPLAGKTVVLSFVAYAGANFSAASSALNVTMHSGTGTDQALTSMTAGTWTGAATPISTTQVLTTTATRYTFTATLASTVTQLGVKFGYTPTGTAGADDNFYIGDVQLEVSTNASNSASDFDRRSYAEDLAICQRYIQVLNAGTPLGGGVFSTTSIGQIGLPITGSMRIAPVFTYGTLSNMFLTDHVGTSSAVTSINSYTSSKRGAQVLFVGTGSPFTAGRVAFLDWTGNCPLIFNAAL